MRLLITPIPPEEVEEILKKSRARVIIKIEKAEPFHGMPRWKLTVEGNKEEIRKFMESLRRSRAGG